MKPSLAKNVQSEALVPQQHKISDAAEKPLREEICIDEHLKVVKRRSLIVSLVMVLVVCPVCPAAAVYLS